MDDINQSKSNSSSNNDNHASASSNSKSEHAASPNQAPSAGKSFKAFGRYNPNPLQQAAGPNNDPVYSQAQDSSFNNQQQPYNSYPAQDPYFTPSSMPPQKLKHSGLGITSFIFSLLAVLVIIIGIIVMVSSISNLSITDLDLMSDPAYVEDLILNGNGTIPSAFIGVIVGVVLMFSSGFFGFIGIIFGIISLFMKNRRKIFGTLGTIFNGVLLVGGFIFFIISLLAAGM